jgi:hypothetical protein
MEIGHLTPAGQSGSFSIGTRETERTLNDLPEAHLKLLDDAVTASMSCLNRNGTIHISPVWVNRDNEHILVNSVRGRQKDRNLRLRRHASLLFNPRTPITGSPSKVLSTTSSTRTTPSAEAWQQTPSITSARCT